MSANRTAIKGWTRAQSRLGRRNAFPVVLLGLLGTACALLQVACIAWVLAASLTASHATAALSPSLPTTLVAFIIAAVLRALLQVLSEVQAARAGMRARTRLRRSTLGSILADGPRLLRANHSGALAALAVDRIEAVDGFFSRYLPAATLAMGAPLLVLIAAWFAQPLAALVLLCCGLAVPVMQALFGIGAAVAARRQFQAMSRLQTRFVDRMRGIATIVLAGRTEDEASRLALAADELRVRTMRVLRVAFLSSAGLDCAMAVAIIVIAVHDGALFLHPGSAVLLTVPHALFALLVVPEFFAPLRNFALAYQDRAQAASCAEGLAELPMASTPAVAPHRIPPPPPGGVSLVFENVSFAWESSRGLALDALSFRLDPGETLLLVGQSGSGKSTVIEMLLGFITPDRGRVLIDGNDLASLDPAALSGLVSWIGQKPLLFAGSLRENILFARPDADAAALDAALHVAALETVVADLPNGLDTRLGEGGYGLSGGQAQRVAIARAVLRDAPLLLLDEPTAHLDPETERAVFDSLRHLARGRSVLMASHSAAAHTLGGRRIELRDGRLVAHAEPRLGVAS
ncbi:thiol reductant ABC exporter subunit CydD [Lichenicoccus sp.]|uniref:thiol reductant ABC exporter subunit CydD n=1 Tax=Lichenicoccus sp. TaxID=2781899 RepID=UPI003D13FD67